METHAGNDIFMEALLALWKPATTTIADIIFDKADQNLHMNIDDCYNSPMHPKKSQPSNLGLDSEEMQPNASKDTFIEALFAQLETGGRHSAMLSFEKADNNLPRTQPSAKISQFQNLGFQNMAQKLLLSN